MTQTRLAVVGLGDAGYTMHLPAAARLPGVTLVGACDTDQSRLVRASKTYDVACFAGFDEMMKSAKPDCVIIATPPDSHAPLTISALQAGCNVICEKPFVSAVDEAEAVIAAAKTSGRHVAVNHEFREMPIFRGVLDAVHAEGREKIVFAQAWQQVALASSGGRVLHDAGVHLIDFMMSAFGSAPVSVSASFSDGGGNGEAPDSIIALTLRFPGDCLGTININRVSKGENHYFDARVDTRSASYRASFGGRARFTAGLHRAKQPHLRVDYGVSGLAWKETGSKREIIARNPADPRMQATRTVLERTLDAFDKHEAPPCTAEWARDVTRVIEAAYASASTSRAESL